MLEVKNLSIGFRNRKKDVFRAIDGLNLSIGEGQTLGIIGESGGGKTVTALAIMGLLPKDASILSGEINFEGRNLLQMRDVDRRKLLGNDIAMIFQEPMTALNPLKRTGKQISEALVIHEGISYAAAKKRTLDTMLTVGLQNPSELYRRYPYEISGGMRQRAMIAGAVILRPKLLIADEPTTALDVSVQAQIILLLKKLTRDMGMALMFISHDFAVVYQLCENIAVMKEGQIVELGNAEKIIKSPEHEYTKMLIDANNLA